MPSKEKKWDKVALKLYRKGKLEEPYKSLFDYYMNMTLDTAFWKSAYLNHLTYFFHLKEEGQLENISANLNRILPENLRDNFNIALEKFKEITDYDNADYDMFAEEDDFVDENAEILRNILKRHIDLLDIK